MQKWLIISDPSGLARVSTRDTSADDVIAHHDSFDAAMEACADINQSRLATRPAPEPAYA